MIRTRMKEYRARTGMKQEELAALVGVRRETIGNLENGKYNPSLVLAWRIARVFGVSIEELEKSDFFKAPASSNFHLNCEGGLVEHSLNVCRVALKFREVLLAEREEMRDYLPKDSVIIASLLHDVCKADIYKAVVKKQKNSFGVWEDVPGYSVDYSNFPLGHGEKSVILLLLWGLDLSDDEIMAIRWHMSSWDLPFQSNDLKGNYNAAKNKCPLMGLVQAADGMATNFLEFKIGEE